MSNELLCTVRQPDGTLLEAVALPATIAQQVKAVNSTSIFAGRQMHAIVNDWLKTTAHPGECLNIYQPTN